MEMLGLILVVNIYIGGFKITNYHIILRMHAVK